MHAKIDRERSLGLVPFAKQQPTLVFRQYLKFVNGQIGPPAGLEHRVAQPIQRPGYGFAVKTLKRPLDGSLAGKENRRPSRSDGGRGRLSFSLHLTPHRLQALKLAHYAYVLDQSRIALEGAAKELAADDRIRKAYLGM